MHFDINKSLEILERTPLVLDTMLEGLSEEWIYSNEGHGTWSPYDILGHLIHGEKTDWVPRMEIILSQKGDCAFESFDRFAQFSEDDKTMKQLLDEFESIRKLNIERLRSKNLTQHHFELVGLHPAFGTVTLSQLLSTWAVHDLNHISQISRVMAKQYKEEVGPWVEYLRILKS